MNKNNPRNFTMEITDRGRVTLRRTVTGTVSTPVVNASTGELHVSQAEASEKYQVSTAAIHAGVSSDRPNRPIHKGGHVLRYATQDEVLDWLTDPSYGSTAPLKPIEGSEPADTVRVEILGRMVNADLARLKGELANLLSERDYLESDNRRLRQQTPSAVVEGYEFPGGPAVLRIGQNCVITRPTKADLPPELVAVCHWRS